MTAFATSGSVSGRQVLGRYELLLPIASGGMARVWAARLRGSRGFQKIVAVKTIRADMAEDPEFGDMLLDEASLASRIRHPQVVEILDLGDHEGRAVHRHGVDRRRASPRADQRGGRI